MPDMDMEQYRGKDAFLREMEKMRPDLMHSEAWSEEDRAKAVELLRPTAVKMSILRSIPMVCRGTECPMAPGCPLLKKGVAPVGDPCPIESATVHQFFTDYVEELKVDVERMVEVSMVRDLVDQEIQQIRSAWIRSQEHFIQENVVGVDSDGNVVMKKELHQAIDYDERLLKRKEKLRNQLLATRESKAKAGQGAIDSATVISTIMDEIRKVESAKEKKILAEMGMEDYDEYIDAELVDGDDSEEDA